MNSSYSLHLSHDDSFVKIIYINTIEAVCMLHHIQIRPALMCVCWGKSIIFKSQAQQRPISAISDN